MTFVEEKTIRRVSDFKSQREETYRYWLSRPIAERMEAIDEIVRSAYLAKGIDIDALASDRTIVRVVRAGWKA